MKIAAIHSYRHADSILQLEYPTERQEVMSALKAAQWVQRKKKIRERKGKIVSISLISQKLTNIAVEQEFQKRGWDIHPKIISHTKSHLQADFRKSKIQVEVQFGNMARWYTDVFKFLLSYSADDIEVGILAVPTQATAKSIDENVAYYERVVRELPAAKMGVTIPILVIGLEDPASATTSSATAEIDDRNEE